MQLDELWLLSSLFWGTIGIGLVMYGRRQTAPAPLGAGSILILASYFCQTTLWMSVISIVTLFVLYRLSTQ